LYLRGSAIPYNFNKPIDVYVTNPDQKQAVNKVFNNVSQEGLLNKNKNLFEILFKREGGGEI